jgi:hypothetical protein
MKQIQSYLQNRHWEYQKIDDDTIVTGFTSPLPDGKDHGFPLYVMAVEDVFGDPFIRLAIVPYIEKSAEGYPSSLIDSIQHINHNLLMAKFALDESGDLELLIDLQVSQLSESQFGMAIQLLADYAGTYYSDLFDSLLSES